MIQAGALAVAESSSEDEAAETDEDAMNIDTLTIGEAKQIAAMVASVKEAPSSAPQPAFNVGDERPVIVRSRDAGVQFGYLLGYTPTGEVHLRDARQMWSWKAAKGGTLLDCANHGVAPSSCKFSGPCSKVIVIGACAIIDCTPAAVATFGSVKWA